MKRLIFAHMVSVDGFIEAHPSYDGPNWAVADNELQAHFLEAEQTVDAHLYGRRVYEQVAAWWPRAAMDTSLPHPMSEYGRVWVEKAKVVFSGTLTEVGWNTRLVKMHSLLLHAPPTAHAGTQPRFLLNHDVHV